MDATNTETQPDAPPRRWGFLQGLLLGVGANLAGIGITALVAGLFVDDQADALKPWIVYSAAWLFGLPAVAIGAHCMKERDDFAQGIWAAWGLGFLLLPLVLGIVASFNG